MARNSYISATRFTMKVLHPLARAMTVLGFAAGAFLPATSAAQSASPGFESEKWMFAATIYGYLPDIGGKLNFPVETGGSSINVDAKTLIDHLKMTFMGALDVHNGKWGAFTDVLYLNVGGSKSQTHDFSIGRQGIPASTTADLNLDLKGFVWTIAGEYRVASDPKAWTVDVLAGARMLGVKPTLDWSIQGDLGPIPEAGRSGSKKLSEDLWDGIVGVKGRFAISDDRRWNLPFYLDVGTGQTQLTWQAAAGVSYSYQWGDVIAMWRYLAWKDSSGSPIESLNFNGPMIGATFRW
jgi:hypothetical protein